MHLPKPFAPLVLLGFAACGSNESNGVAPSVDAGGTCTSPLGDAGFSSLADLPIATLCTLNPTPGEGPSADEASCGSSTVVWAATGPDCSDYWVFDTATGSLKAYGAGCAGMNAPTCTAAEPGFQMTDCSGSTARNLCPLTDAGADASH